MTEFIRYIKSNSQISDSDLVKILASADAKTFQRNEFLLEQGQISRNKIFVCKGLLRNFGLTDDGSEHILQFTPENTWTLDVESYDNGTPARYNIAAIEKSNVLVWEKSDFDTLLHEIPEFKSLSQQIISRNIYYSRQRILTAISASPEAKYEEFVTLFPSLLSRLPLHMIASYLGMSVKTLTRIRHAQLHK
ncbi:cyclic nucleotide-binding domain-containing protein [Flavobacterium sp.]|uniref:Crp/Fnr family transcriptional regulator n=1 Tax=Flavobacterium sp. TaxID=239 RepID=UPI0011F77CEA|nr:cyclic nucleotide-binding domain-containing protein [Flavobacterium sp.]RZJ71465.1 MAG: Crp/Fnr family transcriptional regulator [Flavobacterium sp.]